MDKLSRRPSLSYRYDVDEIRLGLTGFGFSSDELAREACEYGIDIWRRIMNASTFPWARLFGHTGYQRTTQPPNLEDDLRELVVLECFLSWYAEDGEVTRRMEGRGVLTDTRVFFSEVDRFDRE